MAVVDQQARGGAAGLAVGRGQGLDAGHDEIDGGRVIADRAGGAGGGTGATAGTDHRIDGDELPGGRDRAGGAEIETAGAAGLLGAGMSAEQRLGAHVQQLFEGADKVRGGHHGSGDRGRMRGIGAQVAFAFLMRREQRRCAAQVEQDVAFALAAVARRGKAQRAAPGGVDHAQRVDGDRELAKRAAGLAQPAGDDVEIGPVGQIGRIVEQHGHAQVRRKLRRGFERHLGRAEDQAEPLGDHVEAAVGPRGQQGLGQKGGHFGQLRGRICAPTGAVAQIEQGGGLDPQLLGQSAKCPALLGAAENRISGCQGLCGAVDLALAQRLTGGGGVQAGALGEGLRIDLHRSLTIACYQGLGHDFLLRSRALSPPLSRPGAASR